jgi:hypothetical protein
MSILHIHTYVLYMYMHTHTTHVHTHIHIHTTHHRHSTARDSITGSRISVRIRESSISGSRIRDSNTSCRSELARLIRNGGLKESGVHPRRWQQTTVARECVGSEGDARTDMDGHQDRHGRTDMDGHQDRYGRTDMDGRQAAAKCGSDDGGSVFVKGDDIHVHVHGRGDNKHDAHKTDQRNQSDHDNRTGSPQATFSGPRHGAFRIVSATGNFPKTSETVDFRDIPVAREPLSRDIPGSRDLISRDIPVARDPISRDVLAARSADAYKSSSGEKWEVRRRDGNVGDGDVDAHFGNPTVSMSNARARNSGSGSNLTGNLTSVHAGGRANKDVEVPLRPPQAQPSVSPAGEAPWPGCVPA